MKEPFTLDDELVWQGDGHLTDVAVTSLADGQVELLPERARAHATDCATCAERIGQAALLSLDAGLALEDAAPAPSAAAATRRRPLPTAAIAGALVLALLGVLPSLPILRALLVQAPGLILGAIPAVAHSAGVVLESASSAPALLAVLWCAATVMLMTAGLAVARVAPRHASKGEH